LDAFNQKFLALVSGSMASHIPGIESVTLRSVLCGCHYSTEIKVKLVRALRAKAIALVGNADGTIGGLLLDGFACQQFIADARCRAAGNAKTPREVARRLLCDPEAVPGLVRLGFLREE
jgi:hypothetical protein